MPEGFDVDPAELGEGARLLEGVAAELCGARETLINDGDLPTLDPLSKAMSIVGSIIGQPLGPLVAPLAGWAGGAISEAIDPYPPIRNAWEDALQRYCRLVNSDAQGLRDTAEDYRGRDDTEQDRMDDVYPEPVPIPTVPGDPTVPMPTVPGEPTVPMPEVDTNPGDDGPVRA